MKIAHAEILHLRQDQSYGTPGDGGESYGVQNLCLLRLDTDDGITGWADIETQPFVARAVMDAPDQQAFRGIRHTIIGQNPFEVDRLWQAMYTDSAYYGRGGVVMQVMSGVVNACYDIMGKALDMPVCLLLGAKNRDRVRAYASTLFRNTPEQMGKAVRAYAALGFTAIKFGWGVFRDDMGRDVELVAAARQAAGENIDLMVDSGWMKPGISVQNTLVLLRKLEKYHPVWFEDCLHPDNYDGYEFLCRESPVPIAAGEQEATLYGFRRLMKARLGFVQPDLSRCGGLSEAKHIAAYAATEQIQVVPHAWLTDLLTAASLHFNAWLPHSCYLEFNVSKGPLARNLFRSPIQLDNGYLRVPDGPGLGVEPDPEMARRFAVA